MADQKVYISDSKAPALVPSARCQWCRADLATKAHALPLEEELRLNEERYQAGRR
jgi:hypothetical protein